MPMAVGWVSPVLTCGYMFIAGKWLRAILTSCTNSCNPSMWEEFSLLVTSWSYLVLYLDHSVMLISLEVTFSLSFYVSQRWWVITFGTHGVISWECQNSRCFLVPLSFQNWCILFPFQIPLSSGFLFRLKISWSKESWAVNTRDTLFSPNNILF